MIWKYHIIWIFGGIKIVDESEKWEDEALCCGTLYLCCHVLFLLLKFQKILFGFGYFMCIHGAQLFLAGSTFTILMILNYFLVRFFLICCSCADLL